LWNTILIMASSAPRHSVDSVSPVSPTPSRNEYPFPRSVIQRGWEMAGVLTLWRPGSSNRYQPRRGSTASSIHSIGGTLDTASHWHGLSESSQNGRHSKLSEIITVTDHSQPFPHSFNHPLSELACFLILLPLHRAHTNLLQLEISLLLPSRM